MALSPDRRAGNALAAVILGWLIGVGGGTQGTAVFSLGLIGFGIYWGVKSLKELKTAEKGRVGGKIAAWLAVVGGGLLLLINLGLAIVLIGLSG